MSIGPSPSIGGGGYDLGPFIYSWLLIIITFIWSLCVLGVAVFSRSRTSPLQTVGLPAIGAITTPSSFWYTKTTFSEYFGHR